VGCGLRDDAAALVRLVLAGDEERVAVAFDLAGGAFGRGAHLHPRPDCIARASRGLARSFKLGERRWPTSGELAATLLAACDRRMTGLVVAAHRRGAVAIGAEAALEALRRGAPLAIVAVDAGTIADEAFRVCMGSRTLEESGPERARGSRTLEESGPERARGSRTLEESGPARARGSRTLEESGPAREQATGGALGPRIIAWKNKSDLGGLLGEEAASLCAVRHAGIAGELKRLRAVADAAVASRVTGDGPQARKRAETHDEGAECSRRPEVR
jgi:hypothetical protein